ncbi:hypothetical protein D6D15_03008 [Aureobasidium pullulans]|uniref:Serine hydrolase domain-containing protein n=1 Tax=Aureobasidium pullulans TaxID=5580 RepID=A0A4S9BHU5_AURPU|nr:hypothetical protein D6D15_03008 [Aureobasidium pullulans]
MRILCLHGKGTSAAIFESQTFGFRHHLRTAHPSEPLAFDFVDGPILSDPAPGVDHFYEGPFYSFFETTAPKDLHVAHDWLLDLLERRGPYDGVLAFSQGCALVASLLFEIQVEAARARLPTTAVAALQPFKFAVFICGGYPLASLTEKGYIVSDAAKAYDQQSAQALQNQSPLNPILDKSGWPCRRDSAVGYRQEQKMDLASIVSSSVDVCGLDLAQLNDEHKIQIPTVHVYGIQDPRLGSAVQLARVCRQDRAQIASHREGHSIPRTPGVSRMISSMILQAIGQARNVQDK